MEIIGNSGVFLYNKHIVAFFTMIGSFLLFFGIFLGMDKIGMLTKWKNEEFKTKKDLYLKGWGLILLLLLLSLYSLYRLYLNFQKI